jgi:peroxiredoxin
MKRSAQGFAGASIMKKKTARASKGNRPLSESRINRSGLSQGTAAPAFKLPSIDGGEISLEAYRGRRLLLVFSDPQCGPCRALMPELAAFHKRTPDIKILVISRGNLEAVKAELAERPAAFPVAVQKRWEISRRYAMFATPIAYLIDESGVIASEVAIGPEPILILLASAQILTLVKSIKLLKDSLASRNRANRPRRSKPNQATT